MPDAQQWAADPSRRHQLRWWDGERWTEHVSDGGVQSIDPNLTPTIPMAPPSGYATPSGAEILRRVILGLGLAFIVVGVAAIVVIVVIQ